MTRNDGSESTARACGWQDLNDWLSQEMRERRMIPSDVARQAGVPLSTLSGILNAKHRPSLETLDRLARCLARPLDELRELAGDSPKGLDRARPVDVTGSRLQELGWILYDLAPELSPQELAWFVDYARHLQARKRREREGTNG